MQHDFADGQQETEPTLAAGALRLFEDEAPSFGEHPPREEPPTAAAAEAERIARSRAATRAVRADVLRQIARPWVPATPSPDLPRLPSSVELALGTAQDPYARVLLKLDSSPRVFGQATADAVPPFDEPVDDGAVPAALTVQARLADIDLVRTLDGHTAATFRRGTKRLNGATKRASGGLPSRVTETMLRIATVLERGGPQPMDVLVRFASRGKPPTTRHAVAAMQAYGLVESLQIRDTLRGTFGRPIMVHQLTAKGFKHLVQDRLRTRRWSYMPRPSLNAT